MLTVKTKHLHHASPIKCGHCTRDPRTPSARATVEVRYYKPDGCRLACTHVDVLCDAHHAPVVAERRATFAKLASR